MGYPIKQSQTAQPLLFLMIDSTDHLAGKAGLSPTVTLRKVGGAFAAPAGAVTEVGNGWYQVAGNATDSNTLGPLVLHATGTGADPTDDRFDVVAYDPQSAASLGLTNLDAAVSTRSTYAGGAVASVTAPVTVGTNGDKTGYKLASDGLDAVTVEAGLNARQALAVIAAESAGVLAGATGTSITFAGAGVATNRITATVDAFGNRTAVTVSPPT